jgi:flagellar P-ring protein precursor FlgI
MLFMASALPLQAARIKDIAGFGGGRENQLLGYGLGVGLMGTGDDVKNGFTKETIANMLSRQGLSMRDKTPKAKNIASVMVTAQLPPFAKTGTRIDVTVSSIGDATSLQGGQLLMTPLRAVDGEVYALAQGPLLIGGFAAGGANASGTKTQTNVGINANGGVVEREVKYDFGREKKFTINLFQPDFSTATKLAATVSRQVMTLEAQAIDSGTVAVRVTSSESNMADIIARVENIDVPVETGAVIVMNEKTGTVVMGENVRISTVAIAHGNLSIQIKETVNVSQPLPFAPNPPEGGGVTARDRRNGTIVAPGGQTVVTKDTGLSMQEDKRQLMVLPRGVTIQDVVMALNAIGVTPRDLITIIQAIKAAGALQADLKIM